MYTSQRSFLCMGLHISYLFIREGGQKFAKDLSSSPLSLLLFVVASFKFQTDGINSKHGGSGQELFLRLTLEGEDFEASNPLRRMSITYGIEQKALSMLKANFDEGRRG